MEFFVLSPLLLAWLAVPATAFAGSVRTHWASKTGIVMAALTFTATLLAWLMGGGELLIPWADSLNLNLAFELDGLAARYMLLAAGIGLLVLIYSEGYLPHHLSTERQPGERSVQFYIWVLFFMASMIGLVMAQDLLLLLYFGN